LRTFITGITGFVGSHVAELLLQRGYEVLGAGFQGWRSDAPKALTSAIDLVHWDIREPATDAIFESVQAFEPTVIFHFAAISIPSRCGTDQPTDQALAVNVDGTKHLLDLAERLPNPARLVFSSTCHVYGRVDASKARVTEDGDLDPISAYGTTKLMCEKEILHRVNSQRIEATIARGFHHVGPRQPSGLMLTDWLEQLQYGTATEINVRSTNSFLDMVDVRDAARAYETLAMRGEVGGIYNLGSGRVANSGQVLQDLLSIADRERSIIAQSNEERWNTIADISKLQALGWKPQIALHTTLRDMLQ